MSTIDTSIPIPIPVGGQRRDLSRRDLPLNGAYTLNNFVCRNGKLIVRPGYSSFGTLLGGYCNGLFSYDHHTSVRFLVASTLTKWWHLSPATLNWVDITEGGNALTANETDPQVFRTFWKSNKTYLLGVNGYNDAPKQWDGVAANYSDIAGSPPNAKCMAVIARRAILGNLPGKPYQVDVSDYNDFESGWGSVQVVNLLDTPGDIIAMEEIGNLQTAIYKTDSIYMMIAHDGLAPFRFELKQAGLAGPTSSRAVVQTPVGHYYLSWDGDVIFFDGLRASPIGANVKAHLNETLSMNSEHLKKAFGFYNGQHREVWFIYPSSEEAYPTKGIAISADNGSVWPVSFPTFNPTMAGMNQIEFGATIGSLNIQIGNLPGTIEDFSATEANMLLADNNGQVYNECGYVDDGVAIPFELETGMVTAPDRAYMQIKEGDHLFNLAGKAQNVEVELGLSESGEDPEYTSYQTINVGAAGPYVTGHRNFGRLIALRFTGLSGDLIQWLGSWVTGRTRWRRGKVTSA